jgi:hypothetical protein
MAYKFQFGTTRLSGSTTFEEALVGGSTISGSGLVSGKGLVLDATANIGVDGDTDLLTLSSDTVNVSGDLSASLDVKGRKLTIMQNGTVGVTGDTDLMTLAPNSVSVAGALSASGQVDLPGAVRFGTENQTTLSAVGILSSSAENTVFKTTFDRIVAGDADINGGAIDGTVIGGTTEAAVSATTLSASSTLNVVGASNFGPGNLASISAAGVISGSGDSTLHRLDSNRLVFASGSLNGPMYINKNATTVDEILGLTSGSLLYHDEATGLQKLGSFESYASAIAGTGITATNGVLSVDTTGGDSMTATHIPLASYGNAVLSTGINYMTSAATGSCSFVLPSGSAGDVVIVKAGSGVTVTNFVKISSSVGNGDEIDGFSQAIIESEHGAVSLIYSNSDGKWVIY